MHHRCTAVVDVASSPFMGEQAAIAIIVTIIGRLQRCQRLPTDLLVDCQLLPALRRIKSLLRRQQRLGGLQLVRYAPADQQLRRV